MIPSNYHTHTCFCDGKNTPEEMVLEAIRLGCPEIGFSGHHLGIAIDIAAYTLGASTIERHYTLDRTWKGTDHAASLEPEDEEGILVCSVVLIWIYCCRLSYASSPALYSVRIVTTLYPAKAAVSANMSPNRRRMVFRFIL